MAISDIRRAFQNGLGDTASVTDCTMQYLGAGKGHRLTFKCIVKNKTTEVGCDCPPGMKPDVFARSMGEKYAADWGKGKDKDAG